MPISLERQIDNIKKKIVSLALMRPGSLSKQYNICGTPGCKCKDKNNPVKHGPYYYLSYTFKGKGHTKFISKNKVKEVKKQINNYKLFKRLSLKLVEINLKLLEKENFKHE